MFFTYLRRELRRRMRQAIFIALGLALGVGLVITVTAASAGVKNAQGTVLHALYGVGTDVTVTKTPKAGSFTPGSFGFGFRAGTGSRPVAGTKINNNTLSASPTLAAISSSSVATVAGLHDVAAAAGGLTLDNRTISGTVPAVNVNGGGFGGGGGASGSGGSGNGGQSFRANFTTSNFSVAGVDIGRGELGPLSSGKLSAGRTFSASDTSANVALVDASYATQNKLKTGSTIAVGNKSGQATNFKVVGIVSEPAGDNPSDVYIPLAVAQNLASLKNQVNTIYVAASSSSAISSVQSQISKALPGYTVTTSSDLASEVTGSLSSASSLANNLGKWLALAVLIAAFLLASLLTMAAVSRRVREFGTLKALGWKSRRIIGQVMGEAVTLGLIGGAIGIGLGLAGAELVSKLSPKLSAVVGQTTGSATPGGARQFGFGGRRRRRRRRRRSWRRGLRRGRWGRRWRLRRGFRSRHLPPPRGGQPHGGGAPVRRGERQRDPARGRAGRGGRHHRRHLRRLAGRAAASCRRPGQGRLRHRREDSMYKLSGVTKNYAKGREIVAALRGVDLVIEDGEWLAIQGPTGHGKSTLLQILGGLDRPSAGIVDFDGRDLGQLREAEVTRVRATSIGFVFQTFNLIPTLSAQENVEAALVPLHVSTAARQQRAAVALEAVGLGDRLRHVPGELSGGQQQRVAIARALVKEPKVLLADEPTGNLDEDTRDEIIGLLEVMWRERGLTMVLVTHDSTVARRAQRIGVMKKGLLSFRQPARDLTAERLRPPDLAAADSVPADE